MNQFRENLVIKAFNTLDTKRSGRLLIDKLKEIYAAEKHPDVIIRKKTEDEALTEFLDTFEEYCSFVVNYFVIYSDRKIPEK